MQRITISIDETLGATFDRLVSARGYGSRSEGVRDLVREAVEAWLVEPPGDGRCVANLSYVYDSHTRSLPQRLAGMQHEGHDLIVCTTQLRLDHEHTLETVLLRGDATMVRAFADRVHAEKGVRFGALNLISVSPGDRHDDPAAHSHTGHLHMSPRPG